MKYLLASGMVLGSLALFITILGVMLDLIPHYHWFTIAFVFGSTYSCASHLENLEE